MVCRDSHTEHEQRTGPTEEWPVQRPEAHRLSMLRHVSMLRYVSMPGFCVGRYRVPVTF